MRPKKIILCVDSNEQELSVVSFMLSTNGYKVLAATTTRDAEEQFTENPVDLVLVDSTLSHANSDQLIRRLKQLASHVPMILLGDPASMNGQMHAADAVLARKSVTPMELLERIKTMSARKRGPRKGTQRAAQNNELAVAS